uniref:Uncharacterized protein n=1 Tax=Arundo donax TaxID=35708 RepID=A0A0A9F3D9_ARUDO
MSCFRVFLSLFFNFGLFLSDPDSSRCVMVHISLWVCTYSMQPDLY